MLEGARIENQHLSRKSRSHTTLSKFLFIAFAFEILDWGARKERVKLTCTYTKLSQVLFRNST